MGEHGTGSWSCVGEVEPDGSAGAASAGGAAGSSALDAESAARREAMEHVLKNADGMYERNAYQEASTLLAAQEQNAEVLWRRCRLNKSLADQAKAEGHAEESKRLHLEGFGFVNEALQLDENNFAVHKWCVPPPSLEPPPACSRAAA